MRPAWTSREFDALRPASGQRLPLALQGWSSDSSGSNPDRSASLTACYTNLRRLLDKGVFCISGHGLIAAIPYGAGEAGAQATAQSERTRPWSVANRFQAISQASMMSARLGNTELASQWLRR